MKIKHIHTLRQGEYSTQEIEIIQFDKLYICNDKTNNGIHIVYDYPEFKNELKEKSCIAYSEIEFELLTKTKKFNELNFSYHEFDNCWIFLFEHYAFKIDRDGFQIHKNYSGSFDVKSVAAHWQIDMANITNRFDFDKTIMIPKNQIGKMAIQIEHLGFDYWNSFFRCPGEIVDEEQRLYNLEEIIEDLKAKKGLEDLFKNFYKDLDYIISDELEMLEKSEESSKWFHMAKLQHAKELFNEVEKLHAEVNEYIRKKTRIQRTCRFFKRPFINGYNYFKTKLRRDSK